MANTMLIDTIFFIKNAHHGQMYGEREYWHHPVEVMEKGKELFGDLFTIEHQKAALLHDVVEDTEYTLGDLSGMFESSVVVAVGLLTKPIGKDYKEYVEGLANSGNMIAMMVKYADNMVNYMGDKSGWNEERRKRAQAKYEWSIGFLGKKLGDKIR